MERAIVICPYCSLLTFARQIIFPKPFCSHDVFTPPIDNATVLTKVKK